MKNKMNEEIQFQYQLTMNMIKSQKTESKKQLLLNLWRFLKLFY